MNSEALITLCIFLAAQTGTFLIYCGVVIATLRNHDRRIGVVEKESRSTALSVAKLEGELQ